MVQQNDVQIYKILKQFHGKMLKNFQGSQFIKPIFKKF